MLGREWTHPGVAALPEPLSALRKESEKQFSKVSLLGVEWTHPGVAALPDPLSALRKEGEKQFATFVTLLHPLCEAERVDQRSGFGVS
ncbi:hypothetical protein A0256_01965 [Mucilaginibacter sp. PAMC 26640]|nr:hypothetical protein A0256_01965 [Mucilaginibacter sp. PAMC 26640]